MLKTEEEDKPTITKPCLVKAEERRQAENHETLLLNEEILVTEVVTKIAKIYYRILQLWRPKTRNDGICLWHLMMELVLRKPRLL